MAADEITRQLQRAWQQAFGDQPIAETDDFFALGGDFPTAIRLCSAIERTTGHGVAPAVLVQASTPAALAVALQAGGSIAPPALVHLNRARDGVPLFLIPGLSGDALSVWPLAKRLTCPRPIYALQVGWAEEEDDNLRTVEQIAAEQVAIIRARQPHGPYALCGFSFGGLLAFEMARLLVRQGERIELLAMIDPLLSEHCLPLGSWLTFQMRRLARRIRIALRRPAGKSLAYLASKTERTFETMRVRIRKRVLHPDPTAPRDLSYRIRRAQDRAGVAFFLYRPLAYDGPLIVFSAKIRHARFCDPVPIWRSLAKGGAEIIEISASHLKIIEEPSVGIIASTLLRCLP